MNSILVEAVISGLIENGMSRAQAVTAVVTKDGQDLYFGRKRLSDGPPLSELYRAEMDTGDPLSVHEASAVIAYLFGITPEQAYTDIEARLAAGEIQPVTMH